ncbi:hypothetical protein [Aquihabitans sp. McL0605]|uniref:hypothetical protein n=1 Tax=Aquihabitans sp. McL0605 TaxID=3415671 RepID=UPI003CF8A70B
MRRRTRTVLAALAVVAGLAVLSGCGGRTDSGNPGNPAGDVTTTLSTDTSIPSG